MNADSNKARRGRLGAPSRMTVRIYNTLSRQLEALVPLEPGHVRLYVCGMTTYDLCHLGHARLFLAFDVVTR